MMNNLLNAWTKMLRAWLGLVLGLSAFAAHAADLHGCLVEPSQTAEVGSPVVGVIERVTFERGDAVNRGKPLVFLKADVEQAATGLASARAKAEAEVRSAQSNHDFAQRKLQRSVDLQQQNFISQQALDQARTEGELAEQKLVQARENQRVLLQELALARAQLAQRTIVSPIEGVVLERYVTTGQRVEQQTIAKIATLDPLRVEVIVPAAHFNKIRVGTNAIIKPDLPEVGDQQAKVTLVDRVIDTASNSFRVRLELPNPGNALPAGVRCKADFGLPAVAKSTDKTQTPRASVAPASTTAARNVPAPVNATAPVIQSAPVAAPVKASQPSVVPPVSTNAPSKPPSVAPVPAAAPRKLAANAPAVSAPNPIAPPPAAKLPAAAPAAKLSTAALTAKLSAVAPAAKLRLSTKIAISNLPQP
jgi:membrane fusion protein, heavy metal efflux system